MHDPWAWVRLRPGARVGDSSRVGRAKDGPSAERSERSERSQVQPKAPVRVRPGARAVD